MPIVQLYLRGEQTDQLKRMLIEKISEAIVAVGCGPIDRIRIVIQELADATMNGRSAPAAMSSGNGHHPQMLNVFLIEGRSDDVKKDLVERLASVFTDAGYEAENVQVSIQEIPSSAWGIGGKTAQDLGR